MSTDKILTRDELGVAIYGVAANPKDEIGTEHAKQILASHEALRLSRDRLAQERDEAVAKLGGAIDYLETTIRHHSVADALTEGPSDRIRRRAIEECLRVINCDREARRYVALTERIKKAEAELAALRDGQTRQWQPIRTAPSDAIDYVTSGTLCLVWSERLGFGLLYGFVARESEYTHWTRLTPPLPADETGQET